MARRKAKVEEKQEPGRPVGRPTDFRPEYAEDVGQWCEGGLTDSEISKILGVDRATLWRWQQKYPEFRNTIKIGKELADERVKRSLYEKAIGYQHGEQAFPPDTTAAIFWLKNRDPERWRDKTEHDTKVEITLQFSRGADD